MKVIRLQVEYERLFPQKYFNLNTYKRAIQEGLLEKLSNAGFEDENSLKNHILLFGTIENRMNSF